MNHSTIEFQDIKRDRAMRPLFGALAAVASIATLCLMVAGPAAVAPAPSNTLLARRAAPAVTEVAIYPASIEVVGSRAQIARDSQGAFVPAVYRSR